ncbi:MAG TPA: M48 family metallopeptidase [Ideonella sp.]|jgi:predicted Zn-dependent protease|uniref:M48 family metallopeptidase n=1 Tax=Ideonella sp. TaxID=1929293 RepID=UPI002E2F1662|nr:M48 family metallopeptidase [Ideonella sp.]HEX5687687.1 M48 family metallopeptidase [Ideonella sp.]
MPYHPPLDQPPLAVHETGCACWRHQRRRTGAWLLAGSAATLLPALGQAQDGVLRDVGRESRFTRFISAEQIEQAATQQYGYLKRDASAKTLLAGDDDPQLIRLRTIAQRIIPFAAAWNSRAATWRWEVNLIHRKDLNAFCMPGGKIAVFSGLLLRLQLSDDEVAVIMGHEMAHALREHARERMGKTVATRLGAGLISSLFGLGDLGDAALNVGAQLLTLRFSREDESEADLVGLDLAARAGYDPKAGVTLWQKMMKAAEGAPPEFISTHPAGPTRVKDIEAALPKVQPLYAVAPRPPKVYGPPAAAPN